MLSGRRAVDKNRPSGEHNLVEWAKPYLTSKRKIFRVIDTRLEGQYSLDRAQKAAMLALQCLLTEPRARPNMDEVVTALEQICEPKDKLRSTTKEQHSNHQSRPNDRPRYHRRSADASSYPKPSVAILKTYKWNFFYFYVAVTSFSDLNDSQHQPNRVSAAGTCM